MALGVGFFGKLGCVPSLAVSSRQSKLRPERQASLTLHYVLSMVPDNPERPGPHGHRWVWSMGVAKQVPARAGQTSEATQHGGC